MKFVGLIFFVAIVLALVSPTTKVVSGVKGSTMIPVTATHTRTHTHTVTVTSSYYCDPTDPSSPCYNPCYYGNCGYYPGYYPGYPGYYPGSNYGPPAYTTQVIYMTQTFFATSTATISTTQQQMVVSTQFVTSTVTQPVTDPFSVIALVAAGFMFAIVISVYVNYLKKQKAT
jgi:hypothetical protein